MLKEIHEQPEVLERTISAESSKIKKIADLINKNDVRHIILVARGSSDNACIFGKYLFETMTGIPVSLASPSVVTLYKAKLMMKNTLVIGVSQSGEGTDINIFLEESKRAGAITLSITNEADSTMAEITNESLLIHAGREISVAATKTYTGQMLHFYLIVNALAANPFDINKLPAYVEKSLKVNESVKQLAEHYVFMDQCVVLGRGLNYGNSFELGLKLMETCYVIAQRFSTADFFHGPLAMIDQRFPAILFAPNGRSLGGSIEVLEKLKELGAHTTVITNSDKAASLATRSICLSDDIEEYMSPIPFIIPGQLFAAHLAKVKGIDPDNPRSIRKVTQTV